MANKVLKCLLMVVFYFELGLGNIDNATELGGQGDAVPCADVRQVFVMKQIGSSHLVPDTQTKGDDLELCQSSKSCCTKTMEERYKEAVKKDFRNMLQASGSYLKTLITTSATKLRDSFLQMVQFTENSTNTLFSEVYRPMDAMAKVPIGQLYADLLAYISGRDVDLEERVMSFFDSLFPIVYHQSINPKLKHFTDDYKECLQEIQHEIRPFGELPDMIAVHVTRSFEASRTLLQALHLGVEVLNTTEHADYGEECNRGLVKLIYCPHCQGLLTVRPCSGYCLNVLRGCLSNVAELDQSWSDYVSALERLTSGMVGSYNIEQVLSTLDTKISETIMYAMENAPDVTKKVKQSCGHPRRVTRDAAPSQSDRLPFKTHQAWTSETTLYIILQNFVHKLAESKGFYSNLADSLCNDDSLAVRGDNRCWNGLSLGEYSKTIAGVGVSAQKYNPETRPPKAKDTTVATLIDKLQHIKHILTTKVTAVPQSDSSIIVEGSGSGMWWHSRADDEDYADGSGSGDWDKGYKRGETDFNFDGTEGKGRDISIKGKKDAAGRFGVSSVLVWSSLAVIIFVRYHPH